MISAKNKTENKQKCKHELYRVATGHHARFPSKPASQELKSGHARCTHEATGGPRGGSWGKWAGRGEGAGRCSSCARLEWKLGTRPASRPPTLQPSTLQIFTLGSERLKIFSQSQMRRVSVPEILAKGVI